jgi:hypothetical protein
MNKRKEKLGAVTFRYFLKGEYIMTAYGVGIVAEDEKEIISALDFIYSEILIQHKEGCSENVENRKILVERALIWRISKEEYNIK